MTSEEKNGKMSSSETGSPPVEKDGEIPEIVGDDLVGEQEEPPLEQNVSGEVAAAAASGAVDPLSSDAAQILPSLQNLLISNDIQRERLIGLVQLYDPTAQALVNSQDEQIAREAALSIQVHFLQQSVQEREEELENLKKLNAQLEEQLKSLTTSSDP